MFALAPPRRSRLLILAIAAGPAWLATAGAGCADGASDPDAMCVEPATNEFGTPVENDELPACEPEPVPPDCEATPQAAGCPCLNSARIACYEGADATLGVGECRMGRRTCPTGRWSACVGQVTPTFEGCNGVDDDCDGRVDEDALSPCGGCNPDCKGAVWGPSAEPFEAGPGLALTPVGELTLARSDLTTRAVWVPNSGEGTVSKLDAEDAREVARYRTSTSGAAALVPERVAVDYEGDAWVLNASSDGQSTLIRIAGEDARCADNDGDGLETSRAGDQLLPFGTDECLRLEIPVGEPGGVARALAIDGSPRLDGGLGGNVWVGMQAEQRLYRFDGESGAPLGDVATPGLSPYAALFDPWGTLWVIDRAGILARVEAFRDPPEVELIEANLRCYALESIAADAVGKLAFSGFSCENVARYDPQTRAWRTAQAPGVLTTRGIALAGDHGWVVHTEGRLSRLTTDPLAFAETFSLRGEMVEPVESIALGEDSSGRLWVVSAGGGPNDSGVVTRFDPEVGEVTAQVAVGYLPRGQGDIAGSRTRSVFEPEASTRRVFDGCSSGQDDDDSGGSRTRWQRVHVAALAGVDAEVAVEARRADSRDDLPDAAFELLGTLPADKTPFELALEPGGVVELRVTLRAGARIGAPRLSRVGLEWQCAGPD